MQTFAYRSKNFTPNLSKIDKLGRIFSHFKRFCLLAIALPCGFLLAILIDYIAQCFIFIPIFLRSNVYNEFEGDFYFLSDDDF
jgi:hypothetical protein